MEKYKNTFMQTTKIAVKNYSFIISTILFFDKNIFQNLYGIEV